MHIHHIASHYCFESSTARNKNAESGGSSQQDHPCDMESELKTKASYSVYVWRTETMSGPFIYLKVIPMWQTTPSEGAACTGI